MGQVVPVEEVGNGSSTAGLIHLRVVVKPEYTLRWLSMAL